MLNNKGFDEDLYDINSEKKSENPYIVWINNESYISIQLLRKRNSEFFDIRLNIPQKSLFLGRFKKDTEDIRVRYNNGKILIYYDTFDHSKKMLMVTEVLALYDIPNDIFYAEREIEALALFDSSIDPSYLKNENRYIYRTDLKKNEELKIKI